MINFFYVKTSCMTISKKYFLSLFCLLLTFQLKSLGAQNSKKESIHPNNSASANISSSNASPSRPSYSYSDQKCPFCRGKNISIFTGLCDFCFDKHTGRRRLKPYSR